MPVPPIEAGDPLPEPDTIVRGRAYHREYQLRADPNDDTTGVSLAGFTGKSEMRVRPGGTLLLSFDVVVSQAPAGDPDAGKVTVDATEEATLTVNKAGVMDVWCLSPGADFPLVGLTKMLLDKNVTAL